MNKYFDRYEFECKCHECGRDAVDATLLRVLTKVREWAAAPVKITSGNRCNLYNAKVGGRPSSQHLLGKAADIQVSGKEPREVFIKLNEWYPDLLGLGNYKTFTHVDVRTRKSRF